MLCVKQIEFRLTLSEQFPCCLEFTLEQLFLNILPCSDFFIVEGAVTHTVDFNFKYTSTKPFIPNENVSCKLTRVMQKRKLRDECCRSEGKDCDFKTVIPIN
jgi:hypothetical protein